MSLEHLAAEEWGKAGLWLQPDPALRSTCEMRGQLEFKVRVCRLQCSLANGMNLSFKSNSEKNQERQGDWRCNTHGKALQHRCPNHFIILKSILLSFKSTWTPGQGSLFPQRTNHLSFPDNSYFKGVFFIHVVFSPPCHQSKSYSLAYMFVLVPLQGIQHFLLLFFFPFLFFCVWGCVCRFSI